MESRGSYSVLQFGRALAAIAVVLYHANLTIELPKYFGVEPAFWVAAGDSGVHFFFVLSGLIMVIAHWGDLGTGRRPYNFWWKRIRRIVPPLWAALIVSLVGYFITFRYFPDGWTIFHAFAITPIVGEVLLAVEWTLRHEMVFYLLFGLLIWNLTLGAVLLGVWFVMAIVGGVLQFEGSQGFWTSPYHLLFLFGCVAGWLVQRKIVVPRPAFVLAFGAALYVAFWSAKVAGSELPPLAWMAGYGLGAVAMLLGGMQLEREGRLSIWMLFQFLGNASYSIYLIHYLLLSFLAKAAVILNERLPLPPFFWFMAISVGAVFGGIVFYLVVERPLLAIVPARLKGPKPATLTASA